MSKTRKQKKSKNWQKTNPIAFFKSIYFFIKITFKSRKSSIRIIFRDALNKFR